MDGKEKNTCTFQHKHILKHAGEKTTTHQLRMLYDVWNIRSTDGKREDIHAIFKHIFKTWDKTITHQLRMYII